MWSTAVAGTSTSTPGKWAPPRGWQKWACPASLPQDRLWDRRSSSWRNDEEQLPAGRTQGRVSLLLAVPARVRAISARRDPSGVAPRRRAPERARPRGCAVRLAMLVSPSAETHSNLDVVASPLAYGSSRPRGRGGAHRDGWLSGSAVTPMAADPHPRAAAERCPAEGCSVLAARRAAVAPCCAC